MTIEQIAKDLGVSKSTVSRALSGKGRIGEETREKIHTYAAENGFDMPAKAPASLVKTRNIGVTIPADAYNISIPFFQECLLGICEAAGQLEYDVLIINQTFNDISGIRSIV